MAQISLERFFKAKLLEQLISSDYYTDSSTAEDNGLVKMQLLAIDEANPGTTITHGTAQEIEWYQQSWEFVETSATEPSTGTDGGVNVNISPTNPGEPANTYSVGDTVYYNDGEASPTYYIFNVVQGDFIQQDTALVFDVDADTDIVGFNLKLFKYDDPDRTETVGVQYTFESVFAYTNAGTMTISNTKIVAG